MHIEAVKKLLEALDELGIDLPDNLAELKSDEDKEEMEASPMLPEAKGKIDGKVNIKVAKMDDEEMKDIKEDFKKMFEPKKMKEMKGLRIKI